MEAWVCDRNGNYMRSIEVIGPIEENGPGPNNEWGCFTCGAQVIVTSMEEHDHKIELDTSRGSISAKKYDNLVLKVKKLQTEIKRLKKGVTGPKKKKGRPHEAT